MPNITGKNAKLIFRHYLSSANDLFTSESEFLATNSKNKFSILGQIEKNKEKYQKNGYFEFILEYPELKGCNHWLQSVFPTLAPAGSENGFFDLGSSYPGNDWHGLSRSQSSNSFLDGSPFHENWYHPIGQRSSYGNKYCLPNPHDFTGSNNHNCLYETKLYIIIPYERYISCQRKQIFRVALKANKYL